MSGIRGIDGSGGIVPASDPGDRRTRIRGREEQEESVQRVNRRSEREDDDADAGTYDDRGRRDERGGDPEDRPPHVDAIA